jgi:hypothetical protein
VPNPQHGHAGEGAYDVWRLIDEVEAERAAEHTGPHRLRPLPDDAPPPLDRFQGLLSPADRVGASPLPRHRADPPGGRAAAPNLRSATGIRTFGRSGQERGFPADFIAECETNRFAFGDAAAELDVATR